MNSETPKLRNSLTVSISRGPEVIDQTEKRNLRSIVQHSNTGASRLSRDNPGENLDRPSSVVSGPLPRIAQPDLPSDDPVLTRRMRQARTQVRVNGHFAPKSRRVESEVFEAAKSPIIKEILALLGDELRNPAAFERYLKTLSFHDLHARRDHLKDENQRKLPLTTDNEPLTNP